MHILELGNLSLLLRSCQGVLLITPLQHLEVVLQLLHVQLVGGLHLLEVCFHLLDRGGGIQHHKEGFTAARVEVESYLDLLHETQFESVELFSVVCAELFDQLLEFDDAVLSLLEVVDLFFL